MSLYPKEWNICKKLTKNKSYLSYVEYVSRETVKVAAKQKHPYSEIRDLYFIAKEFKSKDLYFIAKEFKSKDLYFIAKVFKSKDLYFIAKECKSSLMKDVTEISLAIAMLHVEQKVPKRSPGPQKGWMMMFRMMLSHYLGCEHLDCQNEMVPPETIPLSILIFLSKSRRNSSRLTTCGWERTLNILVIFVYKSH